MRYHEGKEKERWSGYMGGLRRLDPGDQRAKDDSTSYENGDNEESLISRGPRADANGAW
jgi:hypothetical protein